MELVCTMHGWMQYKLQYIVQNTVHRWVLCNVLSYVVTVLDVWVCTSQEGPLQLHLPLPDIFDLVELFHPLSYEQGSSAGSHWLVAFSQSNGLINFLNHEGIILRQGSAQYLCLSLIPKAFVVVINPLPCEKATSQREPAEDPCS